MGDPYEDLGVPYGSDPETVKDAFSRLSRRLSPERRAAAPAPADAAAPAEEAPGPKPSEEYTLHRFKGRLCLAVGAFLAARGAIGVYLDPGGLVNRLARHVPWIGDIDRDAAFIVMVMGLGTAVWGGGSFLISEREARELSRRRRRRIF